MTSDTPAVAEQVAGITPWDQQKLDAMEGRQQAETVEADGPGIPAWDQGMLDAIDGFQASAGAAGTGRDVEAGPVGRTADQDPRRPRQPPRRTVPEVRYAEKFDAARSTVSRVPRGVVQESGVARVETGVEAGGRPWPSCTSEARRRPSASPTS